MALQGFLKGQMKKKKKHNINEKYLVERYCLPGTGQSISVVK